MKKLDLQTQWEFETKDKSKFMFMEQPELDVTKALFGIYHIEDKINEIIDYLETQKENDQ